MMKVVAVKMLWEVWCVWKACKKKSILKGHIYHRDVLMKQELMAYLIQVLVRGEFPIPSTTDRAIPPNPQTTTIVMTPSMT